ncbi:AHH domain-containing protein [Psychrobacillus sp. FSL K6-1464]|uniref:AHH domain-containing protein n=1 Tax=Psychrobacillus sp. FSL K6-1464 TaxID=2921545 RepID=UPI0030F5C9CB
MACSPPLTISTPTIEGEMCLREEEEEKSFVDTGLEVVDGILSGLFDVGKDFVTGIVDIVQDPKATLDATLEAVTNPIETYNTIKSAITTSYERDMVNGDANSRAHWVTYALGTVATSVVGTKGVGALTKSGVTVTKAVAPKVVGAANNASDSLANLLPYGPRTQFAISGEVPYNTVNAAGLRDQVISIARVESGVKGTTKPLQNHHYATNKSKKYTPQMESLTKKYGLNLDDGWNKELLPHQGRHPYAYHDYVLDKLSTYDRLAKGDREKFLKLFEGLKKEVRDNPDMLYKEYWRSK